MNLDDLKNRFTYHTPNPEQAAKYEILCLKGLELSTFINDLCPESREKSLSITNLEQVIIWANAAIARNSNGDQPHA